MDHAKNESGAFNRFAECGVEALRPLAYDIYYASSQNHLFVPDKWRERERVALFGERKRTIFISYSTQNVTTFRYLLLSLLICKCNHLTIDRGEVAAVCLFFSLKCVDTFLFGLFPFQKQNDSAAAVSAGEKCRLLHFRPVNFRVCRSAAEIQVNERCVHAKMRPK